MNTQLFPLIAITFIISIILVSLPLRIYIKKQNYDITFKQWKQKFNHEFAFGQQIYREKIFYKNIQIIKIHNLNTENSYKMGVNQFTIYNDQQFKLRFLNDRLIIDKNIQNIQIPKIQFQKQPTIPNLQIDWTTKGGVSKIKNQGQCGSCWAFSATGVAQSYSLIFKQQIIDLSEQQLVDCATQKYNNYGCQGGWPTNALQYIKDHGLSYQDQYPYKAIRGSCQKIGGNFKISQINTAQGCVNITNMLNLKPLSVSVDATNWSKYSSGVFNNCIRNINHCVLLVGIVQGAWKVKNSWGVTWGEEGFIRLASGNTCGICSYGGYWVQ